MALSQADIRHLDDDDGVAWRAHRGCHREPRGSYGGAHGGPAHDDDVDSENDDIRDIADEDADDDADNDVDAAAQYDAGVGGRPWLLGR